MMTYQVNDGIEDVVSAIKAMRRQEDGVYNSAAYGHDDVAYRYGSCVDDLCRSRMLTWCYEIIDYCKLNRESIEIMSRNLDRFFARSPETQQDREMFQLASITCLYTTVKIHESNTIELRAISKICRGKFSERDIMNMERKILHTLSWQIHPPTAKAFVVRLMFLIPMDILSEAETRNIFDLANFQVELSILIPSLIGTNASTVAIAALINSMALMNMPSERMESISIPWKKAIDIHCNPSHLLEVQRLIYKSMNAEVFTGLSSKLMSNFCSPTLLVSPRHIFANSVQ
jgi:Cyclin, N-terminal domain